MENEYDKQIAYLTENPDEIRSQWANATGLFKFAGFPTKQSVWGYRNAGCLTMIKSARVASSMGPMCIYINGIPDEQLSVELRNDDRIPSDVDDVKVEHLPAFKEWQEKIDALQTVPFEEWNTNLQPKKIIEDGTDKI